jgi:hypothetical protein
MKYLLIAIGFLSLGVSAQQLPDFTAPANYVKVREVKGDLDKDGTAEIVYVYNTDKKDSDHGFFRVLYICKTIGGKVKLWRKNTSILRSSGECGLCGDSANHPGVSIKNNTLVVKQVFQHSTRHISSNKNIFRYQNGDWFVIGSTYEDGYTCDFDFKYDVNFSTKQVSITRTYEDCETGKAVPKDSFDNFKYPFDAVPKMDGFIPGMTARKVPNAKFLFHY